MEEKKSSSAGVGVMALAVIALFIAVKFLFGMMDAVMPSQWDAQVWDDMYDEKGNVSLIDLRMIPEEEFVHADIRFWMEVLGQETQEEQVFLLYRQELNEYVLYLPDQDRTLKNRDLSATEEMMPDGRVTLVLRARTAEESEMVVPEEQLFCIKSESKDWDGQRVRILVDGREKDVVRMSAIGSNIYDENGMKVS